ncbi:MAG: acetate/propionate family kinase [Devosiaceae bacterium]|nr:acetate/propionate family kinase [Devosiaceae bacterium MH13]
MQPSILTLNAGSSSLKFSVFAAGDAEPTRLYRGAFDRGAAPDRVTVRSHDGDQEQLPLDEPGALASAFRAVLAWCERAEDLGPVQAVGHRIVHGGLDFAAPTELTDAAIAKLRVLEPLAPLHQPHNLDGVLVAREAFPQAMQIGCFDTAFHRTHPFVNDTFGLPHRFYDEGVRRYGFHGLSYDYVSHAVAAQWPELAHGRVVIAHLGNGASMCAVRDGKSVGSTMGFSALDGLPMGTRCGQIDPGVLLYLMQTHGMDADAITDLLYKQSGLKGLSGIGNDMRELLASDDPRARQAIDYFVFRIRREVGGMTAVLGGLDALVFTGGIGENAAPIRAEVCAGFEWLGLTFDDAANDHNAARISGDGSAVQVLVVPTDEEAVIARASAQFLTGG